MSNTDTVSRRPVPQRPRYGWAAWEATVGYIAQQYSPDATLKLEIYPMEHIIGWAASLSWGGFKYAVRDQPSFHEALSQLWATVEKSHEIFHTLEAAARRPANYDDADWLDEKTYITFSQLVNVTDTVLRGDWQIIISYRPVDEPMNRQQARLIARNSQISRSGRGPTLRDACRSLYHNTAPIYRDYTQNDHTT